MLTEEECLARYGVSTLPSDPRARIAITRPWEKATGPRTAVGKLICSTNRMKHGLYSQNHLLGHLARIHVEEVLLQEIKQDLKVRLDAISDRVPELGEQLRKLLEAG